MKTCYGDTHVFKADDDGENSPEDRCLCDEFSWAEMDRILETFETLEDMWAL